MKSSFYSALNKDKSIVKDSSSGGAFSAIISTWYENHPDSFVCGSIMDDELRVYHIIASDEETCIKMRGSKYIPSKLNSCITNVSNLLKNGKYVLFSGTPCQIWGLKRYLDHKKIRQENLFTVEVICHGVAEPRFFYDYISYLESKYKAKAISCRFRSKSKPGALQDMEVKFSNGKKYIAASTKYDWFYSLYHNNNSIRKVCFSCKFAKPERYADISLGDSWGSEYGWSLIVVNSEAGKKMLSKLYSKMEIHETTINEQTHPTLFHPIVKPNNYEEFWKIYKEKGFFDAQKFVGNNTFFGKTRLLIVTILYKLGIKKMVKIAIKDHKCKYQKCKEKNERE